MKTWTVPLTDVRLPIDATTAATDVLRGGWLSMGPQVEAFEEEFARFTGCEHAVACSSGTAALQLALAAAGIGPGDEVVMPSLTFVACANVVRMLGAHPVFADIEGDDRLGIAPEAAQAAIGPRTRALIAMHYGGHPAPGELVDFARDANIALIEDAAHAPGAERELLGPCGSWGAAGCFSFFANKNLPLGEGGMLTTRDPDVAGLARRLRSHGMTTTTWDRWSAGGSDYEVERPGWNLRLDEPRAAMGRALLAIADFWAMQRAAAVARYRALLEPVDGVNVPYSHGDPGAQPVHHLMTVVLAPDLDRDAIARALGAAGIQTSVHYRPIHTFAAYADSTTRLPRTEAVSRRLLTLPLFPHLKSEQIEFVVEALSAAIARARGRAGAGLATPGPS